MQEDAAEVAERPQRDLPANHTTPIDRKTPTLGPVPRTLRTVFYYDASNQGQIVNGNESISRSLVRIIARD
jgi:hypothetical protein